MSVEEKQQLIDFYINSKIFNNDVKQLLIYNLVLNH